jgi:hypothetical protein
MKTKLASIFLTCVMIMMTGCGFVGSLVGGSTTKAAALWADVPAMEGMTQENIDLPLPIKLAAQGLIKASGASEGVRVDNFEVVAFTSAKTPSDVQAFYTQERMKAAGWNASDQPGCLGATDQQLAGGMFCMFGKQGATNESFLIIVATRDENKPQMDLFLLRFDGALTGTPTGR